MTRVEQLTVISRHTACVGAIALFALFAAVSATASTSRSMSVLSELSNEIASQVRPPEKPTGKISGQIQADDGQPLPYITVYLYPVGATGEEPRQRETDEEGRFEFDALPPRAYMIEAEAEGYIEDSSHDWNYYHLIGESLTLMMLKGGVITGTVTNASGEPVVRARVRAVRVDSREDAGKSSDSNELQTDDRGIYRIYGLRPGSYLVRVQGSGAYYEAAASRDAPTYYPSGSIDNARRVNVSAGQETSGIDIRYRGHQGRTISGRLSGSVSENASDSSLSVTLVEAQTSVEQGSVFPEGPDFALNGVPDGEYYMIAERIGADGEEEAASAPLKLTVSGRDISGISLPLAPLGSITGSVVLERSPGGDSRAECSGRQGRLDELIVNAVRDSKGDPKGYPSNLFSRIVDGEPDEKGDFQLAPFNPGHYRIEVVLTNQNWYLGAITFPTRARGLPIDVGRSGLTVSSGARLKGLTIRIAEGAARLNGKVAPIEGASLPAALLVYLAPAEPERKDEVLRFREIKASADGAFAFGHVAPGRYFIVARPDKDDESKGNSARPLTLDPEGRAELSAEAAAAGNVVQLKPCQKVEDFAVRYAPVPLKPPVKRAR